MLLYMYEDREAGWLLKPGTKWNATEQNQTIHFILLWIFP